MSQRAVIHSPPSRATSILGLLVLVLYACGPGGHGAMGSEHVGLRGGVLFTEWKLMRDASDRELGVFHVLMVVPGLQRGGPYFSSSSGGTHGRSMLRVSFRLADAGSIGFELEVEENRWLRAGGREFDLAKGNLIVCVLSKTGDAQLTQLPESLTERADASARLRAFLDQLGPDHPAQSLSLVD